MTGREWLARIADRFTLDRSGCWLWTGATTQRGYAAARDLVGKVRNAHQIIYEIVVGPLDDHDGHHVCGNRRCVNPAHVQPAKPAAHRYGRRRYGGH